MKITTTQNTTTDYDSIDTCVDFEGDLKEAIETALKDGVKEALRESDPIEHLTKKCLITVLDEKIDAIISLELCAKGGIAKAFMISLSNMQNYVEEIEKRLKAIE